MRGQLFSMEIAAHTRFAPTLGGNLFTGKCCKGGFLWCRLVLSDRDLMREGFIRKDCPGQQEIDRRAGVVRVRSGERSGREKGGRRGKGGNRGFEGLRGRKTLVHGGEAIKAPPPALGKNVSKSKGEALQKGGCIPHSERVADKGYHATL